jgi:prepilin-type N-terminal cleavage/methylation domain-containing protein
MRSMAKTRNGFTLVEVLIVVAIVGVLSTIAIVLLASTQQGARIARAQGDVQAIASAAATYIAHTGSVPPSLASLTGTAANEAGVTAGPFLARVPTPPSGGSPAWSAYAYTGNGDGTFAVTATGDGTSVRAP